jgi:hypothetical protein
MSQPSSSLEAVADEFLTSFNTRTPREQVDWLQTILARNNVTEIWLGGSQNTRVDYPYRLIPAPRCRDKIRHAAHTLAIDSDISDPTVTNERILQTALEYDAQFVFPKDYIGDIERTQDSLEEFAQLAHEHNFPGTVIFPLQPPHDRHYNQYKDFFDSKSHIAVGGVKNCSPADQLEAVRAVRSLAGPHTWIHGLGFGASERILTGLQRNPGLLDSLDASTFERLPRFDKIAGADWQQQQLELPHGAERTTLNARITELLVYMANYQLSSLREDYALSSTPTDSSTDTPSDSPQQQRLTDEWATTTTSQHTESGTDD